MTGGGGSDANSVTSLVLQAEAAELQRVSSEMTSIIGDDSHNNSFKPGTSAGNSNASLESEGDADSFSVNNRRLSDTET